MKTVFVALTITGLMFLSGIKALAQPYNQEQLDRVKRELPTPQVCGIYEAEKIIAQAAGLMEEASHLDANIAGLRANADPPHFQREKRTVRGFKRKKRKFNAKIRSSQKQATEKRLKALAQFEVGYGKMRQILESHLEQIRPQHSPLGRELGERLETEAAQHLRATDSLRHGLAERTQYADVHRVSVKIVQLEESGISKLLNAYAVYSGRPEAIAEIPSDHSVEDMGMSSNFASVEPRDTPNVPPSEGIVFSVQILALRSRRNDSQVASIYSGPEKVVKHYEEGWYIYTVGSVATYGDAARLRDETNVRDAFVVAYRNGKRIGIGTAIASTSR